MSRANWIAIVTGGAGGLGAALCERLVDEGATVVALDVDKAGLATLVRRLDERSGRIEGVYADVTEPGALERVVDSVFERFGRLDLMLNNAGVGIRGEVKDFSEAQWRQIFEIDFWSVVQGSRIAYARMIEQGSGQIVNVASLAGLLPAPTVAPYSAAKHAVVGFSLALRVEAEDLGIEVSTVCPGPIATGFHAALMGSGEVRAEPPAGSLSALDAAREILSGMERNQSLIVFPRRARRLWWLWRFVPEQIARINRETIRRMRRRRTAGRQC